MKNYKNVCDNKNSIFYSLYEFVCYDASNYLLKSFYKTSQAPCYIKYLFVDFSNNCSKMNMYNIKEFLKQTMK